MALIKGGEPVEDPWLLLEDGADPHDNQPVLVPLERWLADRERLLGHSGPLGVVLESHHNAGQITQDLDRFALIALEFPAFKDGRAYSTARLLRERMGYQGELRAVGDVLRDQWLFMARCGIDTFQIDDRFALDDWKEAMEEQKVFYQTTGDGRSGVLSERHGDAAG